MAYTGQRLALPLGVTGLVTDDSQGRIPRGALIDTNNVTIRRGMAEKDFGVRRYNLVPLPSGISALYDWFPTDVRQRLIVAAQNGNVYRFDDRETQRLLTPETGSPTTLTKGTPPIFTAGGAEFESANRKLFLFTGANQIQVIDGDAVTRRSITKPAFDWSGFYPSVGFVHRGRLWAFGNLNNPHQAYASTLTDHEDFQTTGGSSDAQIFPIYPGEGERLFAACVFRERVFFCKYPNGVYLLDDSDPNPDNWTISRLTGSFGVASPQAFLQAINTMIVANSTGSLSELTAVLATGGFDTADVLNALRNESFMRENMSQEGTQDRQAIYYDNKKLGYFSYRSAGGIQTDRLMCLDFNGNPPRVTWSSKEQANCLALRRDSINVHRPIYGANDGYVYEMDRVDRSISGGFLTLGNTTATSDVVSGIASTANMRVGAEFRDASGTVFASGTTILSVLGSTSVQVSANALLTKTQFAFTVANHGADGAYSGSFQTPHEDFGFADETLAEREKIFDFLVLTFEESGNWNVSVDVFIDRELVETLTFRQSKGTYLNNFQLNHDRAIGRIPQSEQQPLHGSGRRISFRVTNAGLLQTFKIPTLTVYFRIAGDTAADAIT